MTPLQFSLFFAALLVGYVLVHLRLAKFEVYLREIAGLKQLNDRLKGMAEVLQRVRLDRVEEQLDQIHGDLQSLEGAIARLEHTAKNVPTALQTAAPAPSPAAVIRSGVEARLLSMGYAEVRVLSDLSGASLDEEVEVVVECERRGMSYKGRVVTRNGVIHDVGMRSVAQSFP